VIRPKGAADGVAEAKRLGFAGVVFEGNFGPKGPAEARREAVSAGLAAIVLSPRIYLDLESDNPVIGTYQGVWPGVHTLDDGATKAAPTGAPWIDTNSGFLRFVRARGNAGIWMANRPPEGEVIPVTRYLQAIGDAAMVGARWVVALDSDFDRRLLAREEKALAGWKRIGEQLRFWERHRAWTRLHPSGKLAVIEDVAAGGLLSNGILDMIAARHIPLRALPPPRLDKGALAGVRIALDINPPALSAEQTAVLKSYARDGGMLLSAPPGWTFPPQRVDQIIVDNSEVEKLEDVWHGVNMTIGRENLGVRLFNVATMRSEVVAGAGGKPVVIHLVNYSDYPVENITVRPLAHGTKATLYTPEGEPEELEIFENGEMDIAVVETSAILVLEPAEHEH